MTDEETKQMLRDILVIQGEQLARLEQQDKMFEQHLQRQEKIYAESAQRHNEAMEQYKLTQRAQPWALAIRLVTMGGVVLLLAYLLIGRFHG